MPLLQNLSSCVRAAEFVVRFASAVSQRSASNTKKHNVPISHGVLKNVL